MFFTGSLIVIIKFLITYSLKPYQKVLKPYVCKLLYNIRVACYKVSPCITHIGLFYIILPYKPYKLPQSFLIYQKIIIRYGDILSIYILKLFYNEL